MYSLMPSAMMCEFFFAADVILRDLGAGQHQHAVQAFRTLRFLGDLCQILGEDSSVTEYRCGPNVATRAARASRSRLIRM